MAATVACRHMRETGASRFWMSFKALHPTSRHEVSKDHAHSPRQHPQFYLGLQREHSSQSQHRPTPVISLPRGRRPGSGSRNLFSSSTWL